MDEIYQIIIVCFLLILSSIFSSSETAFFSLDRIKRKEITTGKHKNRFARRLLINPSYLLVTLLFGNMLVNIFASNFAESLFHNAAFLGGCSEDIKIIFAIVSATFVLLIFGEVFPKILAINKPLSVIKKLAPVIYIFSIIVHPFKIALFYITKLVHKIFTPKEELNKITDDELSTIVDVGYKEGVIARDEVTLIQNVLKFANKEARSAMTPRAKVFAVDINSSIDVFIYQAKKAGYSKVPIFDGNRDNIVGVIYLRELISIIRGEEEKPDNLKPYIKEVLFVPEGKSLLELLQDFKKNRLKFAVVIDEYGGTDGIITLDDLIHTITGKFFEEDSHDEGRKVIKIRKNEYLCDADTTLDEFERITRYKIEDKEHDTLAGYILAKLGHIPKLNDKYIEGEFTFKITKVQSHKIEKVLIKKSKKKREA